MIQIIDVNHAALYYRILRQFKVATIQSVRTLSVSVRVRFAVVRFGIHFLSRVIPKDYKKWYSQLPYLALSIKKGLC